MVSDKFRNQLRREVDLWHSEGLIDQQLYGQLAARYGFADLDGAAQNRFVMILLGLGSILLGLGVITFVAANWQIWSREVKILLLMGLFVGVNSAGFYLSRDRIEGGKARLGKGLLLLGAFILGANLGLMSQLFHQSGPVYQLYLIWGLGVTAIAHSLRLNFLAILAVILTGIGYSLGVWHLWFEQTEGLFWFLLQQMPFLASLLFVAAAYWHKSRWLFGLGILLVVSALNMNFFWLVQQLYNYHFPSAWQGRIGSIAVSLPIALLWAYNDSLWVNVRNKLVSFQAISRGLAVFYLSVLFYIFSFNIWNYGWNFSFSSSFQKLSGDNWSYLLRICFTDSIALPIFIVITILAWWQLGKQENLSWRLDLKSTVIAVMLTITSGVVWQQMNGGILGAIATFIFNGFLFLISVGLIRESLSTGKRFPFWSGIVLMVLQLFSRMLEYDTELLFKALMLVMSGFGVIAAGLWFERYLRTLKNV